jgi:hypothetical protein
VRLVEKNELLLVVTGDLEGKEVMKFLIHPNLESLTKRRNEGIDKRHLANGGKIVKMSGESTNKLVVENFEVEVRIILQVGKTEIEESLV